MNRTITRHTSLTTLFLILLSALIGSQVIAAQNIIVVDDYPTVQDAVNALTPGATLWFNNGIYNTSGIAITTSGVHVTGGANATLRSTANAAILKISGDNSKVSGLIFDLNDLARFGIEANGANFKAYDNYLHNGYNGTSIAAIFYNNGVGPAWIQNNKIYDIDAPVGGNNGDGNGAARGIRVRVSSLADASSIFISGNNIELIKGREGDGIHVYSDTPLSNAKIFIENNHIKDVNRRAIKVQAQNTIVQGNIHTNTLPLSELGNARAVIESLQENVQIIDNVVNASLFPNGIVASRSNSTISDNMISAPLVNSATRAIHITTIGDPLQHVVVTGNRIKNPAGTAIDLSAGSGYLVTNNSFNMESIDGSYGIRLTSVTNSTISNNLAFSNTNRLTYLVELKSNSDNNIVVGNNAQFPATGGNYAAVMVTSGQKSLITNNVSNCSTFNTIFETDPPTTNQIFNNINSADNTKNGNKGAGPSS